MLQSWTYKAVFLTCLGGCKSTQQSASNIMLISASLKRIVPRVELWENRSQQWSERATSPSRLSVSSVLSMGSANTSSSPHCTCAASLWTAVWACFCSSEMLTHPDIYPSHPASTDIFSAAEKREYESYYNTEQNDKLGHMMLFQANEAPSITYSLFYDSSLFIPFYISASMTDPLPFSCLDEQNRGFEFKADLHSLPIMMRINYGCYYWNGNSVIKRL